MEGYEITGTSPYYDLYEDNDFWIIDKDKNITAPEEVTIMQGETGSQYIPFRIDRYQDGIDLAEMQWTIIWNSETDGDSCLAVNSYMNSDYIVFAWLIDGKVTNKPGEVAFQIQGTGLNEKEESYVYLTKIKAITITESLDSQRFILEQPQLYNELLNYVQGVIEGSTGTIYAKLSRNLAVMEARISEIVATAGTNTTDTEVADARVRLNGTSAANFGDELRGKADGIIVNDGKLYLTSSGVVITQGIWLDTEMQDSLIEAVVNKHIESLEIPTKTSDLENDSGFLTKHQDISGKLDTDKLPEAINAALTQAAESGEFKGDKGDPGEQGSKGDKGDKGDTGKTAYEYAKDGGYTGSESEFAAKLAADTVSVTYDADTKTLNISSVSGGGNG